MDKEAFVSYTQKEWEDIIQQTADSLVVSNEPYPCPEIGSPTFMKTMDHTLLKLDAKPSQFDDLCAEARKDSFATVCVRLLQVQKCLPHLKGSSVRIACVIGFHEGTYDLYSKLQETASALEAGAHELDIVINYPNLQRGEYVALYRELATLRQQAPHPTLLKLILETSQLDRNQIVAACVLAAATNFDYVKTSTGFNGPGATEENVRLMAACCEKLSSWRTDGGRMKVKASGGIRTLADAVTMLKAGASRLGTSGSVWIAKEARGEAEGGGEKQGNGERPRMQTRLFTDY